MDERLKFVMEAGRHDMSFRELCRKYGVSEKTGYKWLGRHRDGGMAALGDTSRRPLSSPSGLPEDVVCRIVSLKRAHPSWGPRKVRVLFGRLHGPQALPSESTFKRVLAKAGFVEKRAARRPACEGGRIQLRREPQAPNEVWTVDFKGWWRAEGRRCEPLTVRDAFSRYILCAQPLEGSDAAHVRPQIERLFLAHGLPQTIRSDNGAPFASSNGLLGLSALSAWWLALGIGLDRTDPGRPDQNGSHERMHRDLRMEVQAVARGSLAEQREALAVWTDCYNRERPHEALGMRTPAELYVRSARAYRGTPSAIEYPAGYVSRQVATVGTIRIGGVSHFISTALRGWNVGLCQETPSHIGVWFAALRLGTIDLDNEAFVPAPRGGTAEMPP